ncbi:hypothetical protein PLESTB_001181300 [Pleodorina starrii]|uniref:Uncharacterized protein n=1 Tax=Pleodorina starrii TaxID=330485 RepID=A0A9W6BRU6_9CHLO|nr:hypothetical protein PLESTB_001181300 [Pleodorina starrii]
MSSLLGQFLAVRSVPNRYEVRAWSASGRYHNAQAGGDSLRAATTTARNLRAGSVRLVPATTQALDAARDAAVLAARGMSTTSAGKGINAFKLALLDGHGAMHIADPSPKAHMCVWLSACLAAVSQRASDAGRGASLQGLLNILEQAARDNGVSAREDLYSMLDSSYKPFKQLYDSNVAAAGGKLDENLERARQDVDLMARGLATLGAHRPGGAADGSDFLDMDVLRVLLSLLLQEEMSVVSLLASGSEDGIMGAGLQAEVWLSGAERASLQTAAARWRSAASPIVPGDSRGDASSMRVAEQHALALNPLKTIVVFNRGGHCNAVLLDGTHLELMYDVAHVQIFSGAYVPAVVKLPSSAVPDMIPRHDGSPVTAITPARQPTSTMEPQKPVARPPLLSVREVAVVENLLGENRSIGRQLMRDINEEARRGNGGPADPGTAGMPARMGSSSDFQLTRSPYAVLADLDPDAFQGASNAVAAARAASAAAAGGSRAAVQATGGPSDAVALTRSKRNRACDTLEQEAASAVRQRIEIVQAQARRALQLSEAAAVRLAKDPLHFDMGSLAAASAAADDALAAAHQAATAMRQLQRRGDTLHGHARQLGGTTAGRVFPNSEGGAQSGQGCSGQQTAPAGTVPLATGRGEHGATVAQRLPALRAAQSLLPAMSTGDSDTDEADSDDDGVYSKSPHVRNARGTRATRAAASAAVAAVRSVEDDVAGAEASGAECDGRPGADDNADDDADDDCADDTPDSIIGEWKKAEIERWEDVAEGVVEAVRQEADLDKIATSRLVPEAGKRFCAWIEGMFAANTAKGVDTKKRDWRVYVSIVHEEAEALEDVPWPPADRHAWLLFLANARPLVRSYKRFRSLVGNVCEVGLALLAHRTKAGDENMKDPRVTYSAHHRRMMRLLQRQYGMRVKQVPGITMLEARNMFRYIDAESIEDVSMIASFNMGVTLGGRRARTVAGIRVCDIKFRVQRMQLKVQACLKDLLVPAVEVTFQDEKFMDEVGPRMASETYSDWQEDDTDFLMRGCSHWLYRLFVMRGLFVDPDPMQDPVRCKLQDGDVLQYRENVGEYFAFCECGHDWWIDALPVDTNILSRYTRTLLSRFGSQPRGYSAHRRGCVTRAATVEILRQQGRGLSETVLTAIARWGGWQAVTGVRTLSRIYIQPVLDTFICGFTLGLGRQPSTKEWEARLQSYLGGDVFPKAAFRCGASHRPLRLRFVVWHSEMVAGWRGRMNVLVSKMMNAGMADVDSNPVNRFRSPRCILVAACQRNGETSTVRVYKEEGAAREAILRTAYSTYTAQLRLFLDAARVPSGGIRTSRPCSNKDVYDAVRALEIGCLFARDGAGCCTVQEESRT